VVELVDEAGFPPGVWNIVHGSGSMISSALIEHPDIQGVAFVGSTRVAKEIYRQCRENGKRVIAQGGAKNFMLVIPDTDLEKTIPALMTSFYGNTGQRCLSGANAVVVGEDDAFYKKFKETFLNAASRIKIGYGLDEAVQMGPLQSKKAKEKVLGYIEKGIKEGAKIILKPVFSLQAFLRTLQ